jgi:hypothetical protein
MILVDSSVWIKHGQIFNDRLAELLHNEQVLCHDFIIGELAAGSIKNRENFLKNLKAFPRAKKVEDEFVLNFIEARRLYSSGLGYVDIHLLASCIIEKCRFFTFDKRLDAISETLAIKY